MTLCRCRVAVYVVAKKGLAILAGGFPLAPPGSSDRLSSSARPQNAPGSSRITSIGRNLKVPYARRETASGAAQADAPIDRGDGGVNCAFGAQT